MFAHFTIVLTLFSILAFLHCGHRLHPQYNTGPVQCCYTIKRADNPFASTILGLLGIAVSDPDVLCIPITVFGGGNGGCNANPVYYENNGRGSLISIDCTPVILAA